MRVIILVLLLKAVSCARILGIFPSPFYSHQSVFQLIWRELGLRGHHVTVITTDPLKDPSLTSLTEIDVSFTYKLVYEDLQIQKVINTESRIFVLLAYMVMTMNNMTVEQLQHPQVQELIKGDDSFDLVIVEGHTPAWFGFAKKYKCPFVMITSMPPTNFFQRAIGNMNNPVYTPSHNLPFDEKLSFLQRVGCVVFEILEELENWYLYQCQQKIIRQALGDEEINLYEILKTISLLFINEIPGFSKVVTSLPSVVQLNGLQIRPPGDLPRELEEFIDGGTQGTIYFSLGSSVKSYIIDKEKQQILLEAFSELPYRVVWKFEDKLENVPPNVKTVVWVPQQDILRHQNTKLFITQGGVQSIDEAIRFKVPMLGLPFFGDQFYNVMRVKSLKIGTWVDFSSLTKERLKEAIVETVENKTYLENLDELSDLMNFPLSSLDKAVWWIEYAIKHEGAYHLMSPLADIPFYKYYLLDVIAFLLTVFAVLFWVPLKIVKFVKKSCKPDKLKTL